MESGEWRGVEMWSGVERSEHSIASESVPSESVASESVASE